MPEGVSMKKFLVVLLSVLCTCCIIAGVSACKKGNETEKLFSEGLAYTLLEDDTYAVTGIGTCSDTKIIVPNNYKGKAVTSISALAFVSCNSLISITIPNSVKSIGEMAFWHCNKLIEVINNSDLEIMKGSEENGYIGYYALNIKKDGTSDIENKGGWLFYTYETENYLLGMEDNYNKIELILPESYNGEPYEVYKYAFYENREIVSVTISKNILRINPYAFSVCEKLIEVINNGSLSIVKGSGDNGEIGYYALKIKEAGASEIVNKNGYFFYKYEDVNYLLGYTGKETELTLPNNYGGEPYEIYKYAFWGCSKVTKINIPDDVTKIGEGAFDKCNELATIIIGKGVKSIVNENALFWGCDKLESIDINENNITYYSKNNCIIEKTTQTLIFGCSSSIIPSEVVDIGSFAFWGCKGLRSITIPGNVTNIGMYTFSGCSNLVSIIIPDSVKNIAYGLFFNCTSLKNIEYKGTVNEWETMEKGNLWNIYLPSDCVIHCTDGDISI